MCTPETKKNIILKINYTLKKKQKTPPEGEFKVVHDLNIFVLILN